MNVSAHKGEHHADPNHAKMKHPVGKSEREKFTQINEKYLVDVKSIFLKSCFDCHSSVTHHPWYYKVPGIHQLIDSDITEAREHIDFGPDFPFQSHAMPLEDLKAIAEDVEENEMPPLSYRILHKESSLSDKEKEVIKNWVQMSLQILNNEKK
jgi:hypothetical protein